MRFKSDLDALVLGVLQGGALHGYEIAKRIRQLSESTLQVGEGQLYPCLHRLEQEGLVAADWIPQEGKPSRKVYELTEEGFGALAAKRASWDRFADAVARVLEHPTVPEAG